MCHIFAIKKTCGQTREKIIFERMALVMRKKFVSLP